VACGWIWNHTSGSRNWAIRQPASREDAGARHADIERGSIPCRSQLAVNLNSTAAVRRVGGGNDRHRRPFFLRVAAICPEFPCSEVKKGSDKRCSGAREPRCAILMLNPPRAQAQFSAGAYRVRYRRQRTTKRAGYSRAAIITTVVSQLWIRSPIGLLVAAGPRHARSQNRDSPRWFSDRL